MKKSGLSSAAAQAKLKQDGPNILSAEAPKTFISQVLSVLKEPMILLLLGAGGISLFLGEPIEALVLVLGVFFIISITLVQSRRTDQALAALKKLSAPKALVLRDGEAVLISSDAVVTGDLIILREGDRVPADCELVEVSQLSIDESTMTGESFAIDKLVGQKALSGTLVVHGSARGVVVATGNRSEIGQIGSMLSPKEKRTLLQLEVDRLVKVIAVIAALAALTVAVVYGITRGDWLEGSLAGIAAAMALLPEELPIILTVFFGIGAYRMAKNNVLVRSNPAIEMLGQISVLCVDKTGTITKNEMVLVADSPEVALTGLLASPREPFDPTDRAFHVAATVNPDWEFAREYSVPDNFLGVIQAWKTNIAEYLVAAKGAPESILNLCNLTQEDKSSILQAVDSAAREGFRVLAVARLFSSEIPLDAKSEQFEFIGLARLSDPVREGVQEAVSLLQGAGVRTVMITGDYPVTAKSVAHQIGLRNQSRVITGDEIDELDDLELRQVVEDVDIFSRMRPAQKLRLVEALKSNSEIVAMTGDGVNDSPALKAANIGIAMGMRGSEVAREAADLVIADDSFISIAEGVRAGRRIFGNLRKAATYIIAIHIPIFAMALVPLFNPAWPLVLLPIQIALMELLIDPASSLAYEAEKSSQSQMKTKPRRIGERLITKAITKSSFSQGIVLFAAALAIYINSILMGESEQAVRGQTFAVLILGNLLLMLGNRSASAPVFSLFGARGNTHALVIFLVGLGVVGLLFSSSSLAGLLQMEPVSLERWPWVLLAGASGLIWLELGKIFRIMRQQSERLAPR